MSFWAAACLLLTDWMSAYSLQLTAARQCSVQSFPPANTVNELAAVCPLYGALMLIQIEEVVCFHAVIFAFNWFIILFYVVS